LVTPLGWMLRGQRPDPQRSVRFAPELAALRTIAVTSPDFEAGGRIPRRYCGIGRGQNVSPALDWIGVPQETRQLLLILEDTDAPLKSPIVHMIALLVPGTAQEGAAASGGVAEGALTPGNLAVQYVPAFRGWLAYQGPRPLPGHGAHHYGFHLFALDRELDAHTIGGLGELLPQAAGHVLASGVLVGTHRS
jgi:Raf kinase inhibitor-like YbhB/YbcL family protein